MEKLKLGKYVCVMEGRVFFNSRIFNYGDEVLIDDDELLERMQGRFIPKEDFEKQTKAGMVKVKVAADNGKTLEEVEREHILETEKMKAEYEAQILELKKQIKPVKEEVKPVEGEATTKAKK